MKQKRCVNGMNDSLGKNWLLLRGLARESAHWGDFLPQLQTAFPQAQINTLDLPGTGQYFEGHSPRTIEQITKCVRSQAQDLGLLEQPITLFALSLGGMVAWEWLQNYPTEVCGATLVSTSFAGMSPFYERLRWQIYPDFFALIFQPDMYQRELAIAQLVNNNRSIDDAIAQAWEQIQQQRPVSPRTLVNQLLAAAAYRPKLISPTQPILLLNAKGDRLVASSCSEKIQKKWNLPLRTHPWAGHDLTVDDGEWVVLQLKEWLVSTS